MGVNISGRSFLKLLDFSTQEIEYLLALSRNLKDLKRTGTPHRYLEGKNIVLLFQKTSTRTRCSFEVGAMDQEGVHRGHCARARPHVRRHRVPRFCAGRC